MKTDLKGKDQGLRKDEVLARDKGVVDYDRVSKGPKQTRWDKQ